MDSGEWAALGRRRQVCGHGKHQLNVCHHSSHIKHPPLQEAGNTKVVKNEAVISLTDFNLWDQR